MTCRFPDNCQKKPDPRRKLCRGCAQHVRLQRPEERAIFAKRLAKANEARWDWCPIEHRELYIKMRDGNWTAAEAKAEVLSWARESA